MSDKTPNNADDSSASKKPDNFLGLDSLSLLKMVGWSILKNGTMTVFNLGILLLIGLIFYGVSIESEIKTKFEGKRWDIPAQAYARPLELYTNKKLPIDDFLYELDLLGYLKTETEISVGSYKLGKNTVELITRKFAFSDGVEPSKHIIVTFFKNKIQSIKTPDNKDEFIIRLDPLALGSFYAGIGEDRTLIKLSGIPDIIPKTLIAVEDKYFYSHFGISPLGIVRAMMANIKAGKMRQGASTITQQLAKNFYLDNQKTIIRKIKEAVTAVILEIHYDKDEILEVYLNEVFFSQNGQRKIHGIAMASQFFYGRPPKELTIGEVATLIGLLKATTAYNPRRNPTRAKTRRDLIIDILADDKIITPEIAEIEKNREITTIPKTKISRTNTKYPAFMGVVKNQLLKDYNAVELKTDGIKVFTTLNPITQRDVNLSVKKMLPRLDKRAKLTAGSLQTAMIVAKIKTGEIEAVVGDRNYKSAGFNRAINAKRQIGSLIKPIIYLSALKHTETFTLATPLNDTAFELRFENGLWKPRNYENEYERLIAKQISGKVDYDKNFLNKIWEPKNYKGIEHNSVLLIDSLVNSYNLSTARLGIDVGISNIISTLKRFGYKERVKPYPSTLLGAINMSPIQVTQYFLGLANRGFYIPLRSIKSVVKQNGEPLKEYNITLKKIVDSDVLFLTYSAMRQVVTRGTAKKVSYSLPRHLNIAGKTGTTNDSRDSWFAGFGGNYLTVSWIGRDNNKTTNLTGSSGALTLWIEVMKKLSLAPYRFKPPKNIVYASVHKDTGSLVNPDCKFAILLPFIKGSVPKETSDCVAITIESNEDNNTISDQAIDEMFGKEERELIREKIIEKTLSD